MVPNAQKAKLAEASKLLEQTATLAAELTGMIPAPSDASTLEQAMFKDLKDNLWAQAFVVRAMNRRGDCGPFLPGIRLDVSGTWDANQQAAEAWVKSLRKSVKLYRGWILALHALEAKLIEVPHVEA